MRLEADVSQSFGKKTLAFSFQTSGPRVGLRGPSGSGKTTLLRILAGLERSARGHIHFGDEVWLDSKRRIFRPAWKRNVGWVPQDALCFPHLSVKQNLEFSGRSTAPETRAMAESLGILALLDRRVRNLSGGERHRVSLGRALLAKPKLLLLDESFSALDRPLRAQLVTFVREFTQARGIALIVASHDEDLVSEEAITLGS